MLKVRLTAPDPELPKLDALHSADKAFRGAVFGINEDNVFGITPRCVNCQEHHRLLSILGQGVDGAAPADANSAHKSLGKPA